MKITTDNMSVDSSINTYKCPVIGEGTVLLLPSQVKKYLGSYSKHKLISFGILLPKNTIVNIISEEVINGNKWLLVVYNNTYYYTPKEYIDCSKIVDINLNINNNQEIPQKYTLRTPNVSTSSSNNHREDGPYTIDNCKIAEALDDIVLREDADPNSTINRTMKKGEQCIVQSIWKNDEYNSKWFCTATYTPGGGLYGCFVNNVNVKITTPDSCFYSMIISDTECKYTTGATYGKLIRGDITWPKYQDWTSGTHVNVAPGSNGGLLTYTYPASVASPIADSDDMFNSEWLGELTIDQDATIYAFHRKSNYNLANQKEVSLDSISLEALKYTASKNDVVKRILEYGFGDRANSLAGFTTNAEWLTKNQVMVVTNYTTILGKNYYIGFRKSSSLNGAIYYIALLDDKDHITYSKYPPRGTDISETVPGADNIDNSTHVDYSPIKDVTIDTSYVTNPSNVNDPTRIVEEHNTKNDDVSDDVFGIHLGKSDTSEFKVPGILTNAPETPPEYSGWSMLEAASHYNLSNEKPFDTKHLTHINRFRLPTGNSGLSTKSFIFVTRPDLNLYHESDNGSVNGWAMNPDLKRLPCFKYIARMRGTPEAPGIGSKIMASLEYWGTNGASPWLAVFTNQANGYSVIDRELDTTEMGETFHGNKIIYAEPTFKHKIGGTVQIPFTERRDLTLYYTLRMWVEYIQAVSVGFCSPRIEHKQNYELDYAVSLFYITTDETMENILYWEKLTGLIPLTVPDSFFEWSEGNGAREMKYSINFAYSFRTVMDEMHLAEINNLYKRYKTTNATGMPIVPENYYDYNYDSRNNELLSRVSAFYRDITTEADDNSYVANLINNKSALEKYYYGGIASGKDIVDHYTVKGSDDGSANGTSSAKFLPNYNIHTRMYGVPYVKGPFIEHDPDAQKYKLRWV